MDSKESYSLFSLKFWQAYLITMRPYLLFISGAAGLVGLAVGNVSITNTILAFIPLFLSYGFGQALTDCFQIDTDSISAPYRPLVRGIISRKQVLNVSIVGLTVSVFILGYLNPNILILGILAVIGLLTYTFFKRRWWGGPPWNSWIVALLPIMGLLVDKEYQLKNIMFLLGVVAVFFAYANFVVMGYLKDISADRKTGYQTFPVVFGWQKTAIYSDLTALASASATGYVVVLCDTFNIYGLIVFIVAIVLNFYAQLKIHQIEDETKSHRPIENVVRVFVLYCLSMVVTFEKDWIFPMTIFYLLFELTLRVRPEKMQV